MRPLNKDEEVHVKSFNVPGKVLRVRPGDIGEPEEQRLYEVQITRYFRRTDLESVEESDKGEKLQRFSEEWLRELQHFTELGLRLQANPGDKDLIKQCCESGSKIGFFVPTE